jgi:hypothetical protein
MLTGLKKLVVVDDIMCVTVYMMCHSEMEFPKIVTMRVALAEDAS